MAPMNPHDYFLIPLAHEIRMLRLKLALSQRDLARLAAVRQATISSLEQGHPARPSTIRAVAAALGVSVSQIATLAERLAGASR